MMDIVKVLRDPELIPHKRALLPAAISNAADEIERLRAVVGSIERVAACGTAEAFLGISDDGKRLHFAMSVRDAGRLKKAQEEIERLRAELAECRRDAESCEWFQMPRTSGWYCGCQAKKGCANLYSGLPRICPWCKKPVTPAREKSNLFLGEPQ